MKLKKKWEILELCRFANALGEGQIRAELTAFYDLITLQVQPFDTLVWR